MKDDNFKGYQKQLNEHGMFRAMAKSVADKKPNLPDFNPHEDNTDDWKVKTGMKQGFDLAFRLLTGYRPEDYQDE